MANNDLPQRLRERCPYCGPCTEVKREAADAIDYAIRAADVNDRALDELTTERDQSRMSVVAMDRIYDDMKEALHDVLHYLDRVLREPMDVLPAEADEAATRARAVLAVSGPANDQKEEF